MQYIIAPVIDTVIKSRETVQLRAHVTDTNVGSPDGLNGVIAVSADTLNPCITISESACTVHNGQMYLLVTNETDGI